MSDFKTIAERHPESVALVFQKHHIAAPSNEKNLINAIKIKGEVFTYDLADAIDNEQSSFLGLFESKEKRAAKKAARQAKRDEAAKLAKENPEAAKKGFTLDKALNILGSVAGIAGTFLGSKNAASSTTANNGVASADPEDLRTERILGIDRNMFYVLAVLGIILLFMVIRKAAKSK